MWVVFSTGKFGQELASFETECEAHEYIMRKKEVTFNTGFKKKFVEKKCCETCSMNDHGRNCKMWHWTFVDGSIDLNSMCCKEDWEAR